MLVSLVCYIRYATISRSPSYFTSCSGKSMLAAQRCMMNGGSSDTYVRTYVHTYVRTTYIHTGWLKLKYPTIQNAISRQPCEIFIPKFLDLYGTDPATILIFFKLKFYISPKLLLYKYSMPYVQFCTE